MILINNYFQLTPAYLRVYNTSKLKYSARVNYDVACPMTFEEYPVDTQRCNISLESWGHPSEVSNNNSLKVSFLKKAILKKFVFKTHINVLFYMYVKNLDWHTCVRNYNPMIDILGSFTLRFKRKWKVF